jgi:catechol 2,3-dioxygenase-like lactoylglutathione lyase family enzyme
MKLNHLNLTVTNVAAAKALFVQHFGFTYTEAKGSDMLAVLYGSDGFILTLMSDTFNKTGILDYPAAFHFGFILPKAEEVTALYESLKAGGIAIEKEPAAIRNSFGFYFHFDRLMIEIGHYFK